MRLLTSDPDRAPVESLLEADFYKFTMGQFVLHRYRGAVVTYKFTLRTKNVRLADTIPLAQLREAITYARQLKLTGREIHYLRGVNVDKKRMLTEDYIDFLADLRLPEVEVEEVGGNFDIAIRNVPWETGIYWETLILNIVNELYYRNLMKNFTRLERDAVYAQGIVRLAEKVKRLKRRPWIKFADFGNRRRFSADWQRQVDETLAEELPGQFRGTSNVYLAMELGLDPIGTNAHELPMAVEALLRDKYENSVAVAQRRVLDEWYDEFGEPLSIGLTDTFGTDTFLRNLTTAQAEAYRGFRQDSGDPLDILRKYETFYCNRGVDPTTKLVVPSDGLDIDTIFQIDDVFKDVFRLSFGWGTTLTNDLGFPTLSIVIKLVEINGVGTVKLSDNMAKASGRGADIELVKKAVDYNTTFKEECKV
jgi:nicotinate phosphoribosyltransferase